MSGIAGILRFDGEPIERETLERMLTPLETRGPHGKSLYLDGNIGLGFTLLNTTPHTNGTVVFINHQNSSLPITFDGRLDNRRELIEHLGVVKRDVCDAELVQAAYQKWGGDCPKHLLGDFAFALWDHNRSRLFCARDHFGVKPFYYHYSNQYFIFASTPYAILAARRDLAEINEIRIADFLAGFEGIDETITFYKRIFRLPRRRGMIVDARGLKASPYWDLHPVQKEYANDEEYIESFNKIFSQAVKCRLGAPDRTIIPLSGGMDSTSIIAIAREAYSQTNNSLVTISGVTPDSDDPETDRIQSVVAQRGLNSRTFSDNYVLSNIDNFLNELSRLDEPFDTLENTWRALYGLAREDKLHVSLDGVDGDITLAGVHHVATLWKSGDYRNFLHETLFAKGMVNTYYKSALMFFLISLRPLLAPEWTKKMRRAIDNRTAIFRLRKNSLINLQLAHAAGINERYQQYASYNLFPLALSQMDAHKQTIFHPHMQAALERYDRIASAFSIEARHPFMDVRLMEFCLGLPWWLKTQGGWNKMILRKAMETLLPEKVVWGSEKKHPNWLLSLRLLRAGEVFFQDTLGAERKNLKNYIDIERLDKVWNDVFHRGNDTYVAQIWEAIGLALWLRRQKSISS